MDNATFRKSLSACKNMQDIVAFAHNIAERDMPVGNSEFRDKGEKYLVSVLGYVRFRENKNELVDVKRLLDMDANEFNAMLQVWFKSSVSAEAKVCIDQQSEYRRGSKHFRLSIHQFAMLIMETLFRNNALVQGYYHVIRSDLSE